MPVAYAHIDCNNFYASCERVFDPALRDRPVAILSNNDGCIIARSEEAKKAGVQMGAPEFQQRDIFKQHNIVVLSSNYALYGDMSHRVMETLRQFTPYVEPYSIDEAFLELPESIKENLNIYGREIKETIGQWTGIPVSVGIAPSKTLAKIANETAKENGEYRGVLNLADNPDVDHILESTKIIDIWGIGAGFAQRLHKHGITNALQLKQKNNNTRWVRNHLNVNGLRTVMELNGNSCIEVENKVEPRKGIMTSRSFGTAVTRLTDLKEAVAHFTSIAAEKLRKQQSIASIVCISLRTNKYAHPKLQYKYGSEFHLPMPSAHSPYLIECAHKCLEKLFEPGLKYKKAAVMLIGIIPESEIQMDLFEERDYSQRQQNLMDKVDFLNRKFGSRTTLFAGTGITQPWQMKQQYLSNRYTTRWDELMEAGAS